MNGWQIPLIIAGVLLALACFLLSDWPRRMAQNRRRRGTLPPPASLCRRDHTDREVATLRPTRY